MIPNNLVVFRFVLTRKDSAKAEIGRITAEAIDPRNLAIYPNSRFDCFVRPDEADAVEEDATRTPLADLMGGLNPREAWDQFALYCGRWNLKGRRETRYAPIPVGYDFLDRDWAVYRRYAEKFGTWRAVTGAGSEPTLFNNSVRYDLYQQMAAWSEGIAEVDKITLDAVRKQVGVPKDLDHVAAVSALALRMLAIQRKRSGNTIFQHWFDEAAYAEEKARRNGMRSAEHARQEEKAVADAKRANAKKWKKGAA